MFLSFGIFDGHLVYVFYGHLVNFVVFWYIFVRFGLFSQEKSGNRAQPSFLPMIVFLSATLSSGMTGISLRLATASDFSVTELWRGSLRIKLLARVARWFVFKPKILIWVNFVGP
jgi:hypothetical protein